jgi:acetylornithine deacetylase/succinyl-diaminopimelate desuccinylase-like protein
VISVPEKATITINRHTGPGVGAEVVLAQMRTLAAELDSPAKFDFAIDPPYYPPWEMPLDDPLVVAFGRAYVAETGVQPPYAYTGFGDANIFNGEAGIPTVQFGPLGGGLHEADEWVDVGSIGAAIRVVLRLILDVLPPARER